MQVTAPQAQTAANIGSSTTYTSFDSYKSDLLAYGEQQTQKYAAQTAQAGNNGILSVDDLKADIRKNFSQYEMTSSDPSSCVKGKNLLYIDDANLQKMANDPGYRAKVYGLMARETSPLSQSMTYRSGDQTATMHMDGTVFSLSDQHQADDGIPYSGMGISSGSSVSTTSNNDGASSKVKNIVGKKASTKKPLLDSLLHAHKKAHAAQKSATAHTNSTPPPEDAPTSKKRVDITV